MSTNSKTMVDGPESDLRDTSHELYVTVVGVHVTLRALGFSMSIARAFLAAERPSHTCRGCVVRF